MLRMLHTTFSEPVGLEVLREVKALGFEGVRVDIMEATPDHELVCIEEAIGAGLIPLVIVRDAHQLFRLALHFTAPVLYELENEPDIGFPRRPPIPASRYRNMVLDAASTARAGGVSLYVGAISNPLQQERGRRLRYLGEIMSGLDHYPEVGVTMHWYRHGRGQDAHPGFRTLDDEVAAFRSVIGARPWGCSETGDHTGQQCWRTGWWRFGRTRCEQFDDDAVKERAQTRQRLFEQHGADFSVWYQLNDGPEATNSYGIRRQNGMWKPAAHMWHPAETV